MMVRSGTTGAAERPVYRDPMSNDAARRSRWRAVVGQPRLWVGIVWTALGVAWLAFGIPDGGTWRWVIGILWLALGVFQIVVAASDRKHHRGRYAGR